MRIYIIGPAGSGKTTLSVEIGKKTGIETTDLDDIFWDNNQNDYGKMRPEVERNSIYQSVLRRKSWIIEGAYLNWPKEGFRMADKFIYLDIPIPILNYRIIKRFIFRRLGIYKNKKKETWKSLGSLLKWNKNQAKAMKETLENSSKAIPGFFHIRKKKEMVFFLRDWDK